MQPNAFFYLICSVLQTPLLMQVKREKSKAMKITPPRPTDPRGPIGLVFAHSAGRWFGALAMTPAAGPTTCFWVSGLVLTEIYI